MSEKKHCDICDKELRFTKGSYTGKAKDGIGVLKIGLTLWGQLAQWLGGLVRVSMWRDHPRKVGGGYFPAHICSDCCDRIGEEVKQARE